MFLKLTNHEQQECVKKRWGKCISVWFKSFSQINFFIFQEFVSVYVGMCHIHYRCTWWHQSGQVKILYRTSWEWARPSSAQTGIWLYFIFFVYMFSLDHWVIFKGEIKMTSLLPERSARLKKRCPSLLEGGMSAPKLKLDQPKTYKFWQSPHFQNP